MNMRNALKEVRDFPPEQLDESLMGLLRTTAIVVNIRKSLQSGNKVKKSATELRQIGTKLKRDKTPEDIQKTIAEGFIALSETFENIEDMLRRNAYISSSSGLFSDRTYNLLKKIERKLR